METKAENQDLRPLQGVRVLDISGSYAGPTGTMFLAELGATVTKIEPLSGDDSRSWGPPFVDHDATWYLSANRGKRSLALDITSPAGAEVLQQLISRSDVFVENVNPDKLERLGIHPDHIRHANPRLIYCAISGFGLSGPDRARPGYDLIAQAGSGIMSVTGASADNPQRVSTALSDVATGMVAALAICAAIVRQQRTGQGDLLDISLLSTDLALMNPRISSFLGGDAEPRPCGARDSVLAVYESFEAADRRIVLAVGNDSAWRRLCGALGLDDLLAREELRTNTGRRAHRDEISAAVAARIRQHPAEHWHAVLGAAGIPHSNIRTLSEVVADSHVQARGDLVACTTARGTDFRTVRAPWRTDADRLTGMAPHVLTAPALGEHTEEVLLEAGLSAGHIAELAAQGVVGGANAQAS